jgi:hypothetical protein
VRETAAAHSRAGRREHAMRLGETHEIAKPPHLRSKDAASKGSEPIIDAPRVIAGPGRTRRRLDELIVLEPPDVAIQASGLELEAAATVLENVLTYAIPVAISAGEHREDQRVNGAEREE